MDILLTNVTPDSPGFAELKSQSMAEGFNMLRRLEDNWLSGQNRFERPGEKLIGASVDGLIFINTNAPPSAFTFYERAGFVALTGIEKVTHPLCLRDQRMNTDTSWTDRIFNLRVNL